MNLTVTVNQKQLLDVLLNVGLIRPVFIWGAPGIGKSAIVQDFADSLGLDCVSLLGSQLAPEDIIGVPWIQDGFSQFCPPRAIARSEPYVLFLDELNACSSEVQKAFYSLIHERRIGEYRLPEGSIVVGAGNRAQDNAITRPMSSALVNRMFHVELTASPRLWLEWAARNGIHPYVYDYIASRPDHLWAKPPKSEEPFSTPRSWHMLSDAIQSYGSDISEDSLRVLAAGSLCPRHATSFLAYIRQIRNQYALDKILSGEHPWPSKPEERDVLYFLAQSLRARLVKELPMERGKLSGESRQLVMQAKDRITELAEISLEIARTSVSPEDGQELPDWFVVELFRDLPRLADKRNR